MGQFRQPTPFSSKNLTREAHANFFKNGGTPAGDATATPEETRTDPNKQLSELIDQLEDVPKDGEEEADGQDGDDDADVPSLPALVTRPRYPPSLLAHVTRPRYSPSVNRTTPKKKSHSPTGSSGAASARMGSRLQRRRPRRQQKPRPQKLRMPRRAQKSLSRKRRTPLRRTWLSMSSLQRR